MPTILHYICVVLPPGRTILRRAALLGLGVALHFFARFVPRFLFVLMLNQSSMGINSGVPYFHSVSLAVANFHTSTSVLSEYSVKGTDDFDQFFRKRTL